MSRHHGLVGDLGPGTGWFNVALATVAVVVSVLPPFVLGAESNAVSRDLNTPVEGMGLLVALFFGVAALCSIRAGRFADRVEPKILLLTLCLVNGVLLLMMAYFGHSLLWWIVLFSLGGIANSFAQPSANVVLTRNCKRRLSLAFGAKQSSIPLGTLLGGLLVPTLGVQAGWQWTFIAGSALAFSTALSIATCMGRQGIWERSSSAVASRPGKAAAGLGLAAISLGLGAAAATALAAFLVPAAIENGSSTSTSGWLLAIASLVAVGMRLLLGWQGDRLGSRGFWLLPVMLALGALGYALLAMGGPALTWTGTLLAYGAGWGWPGLLAFIVVNVMPNSPASATGLVQTGGSAGAALGPMLAALLIARFSFGTTWACMAIASMLSCTLIGLSGVWLAHRAFSGTSDSIFDIE